MNLKKINTRAGLALLMVAAPLGLMTGPVGADPVNAKRGNLLPIVCDVLGTFEVATNGNGRWTPGLVTTNNQVGIPYEFHNTGTFTPPGGPTETFTEDLVKRAPRNGRLDTCTFHLEGTDEFGTFTLEGLVKISYTPAKS